MARRRRTTYGPGGVKVNQEIGSGVNATAGMSLTGNGTVGLQTTQGTDDVQVNAAAGINPISGSPSGSLDVTFGNTPGSKRGAMIGQAILPTLGGKTVGSLVGNQFNESKASAEGKHRDSVINAFKDEGVFDNDYNLSLPDGTVANFDLRKSNSTRDWYDARRRVDKSGDRGLFDYESDYTNDLDYVASMGGTTLSRVLAGGSNKAVDQVGQLIGNRSLGKLGHGAPMDQKNFKALMTNQRAIYAKKGIQNKEDLNALVNTAYSQGRVNDTEAAGMMQVGRMLFDEDYNFASTLMQNRWSGIQTAAKTPTGKSRGMEGKVQRRTSPFISIEEATRSVQPLVDMYKSSMKEGFDQMYNKTKGNIASVANGVAMATGAYKIADTLSGGEFSNLIKGGAQAVGGALSDLWGDVGGGEYDLEDSLDLGSATSQYNQIVDDTVGSELSDLQALDFSSIGE